MNEWSMSNWMIFRPILTVALVFIVIVGGCIAVAIGKLWTAWRGSRAAGSRSAEAADALAPAVSMPQVRHQTMLSSREAANDSRPRAA